MQANLDATLNALQASAAERDARQLSRLAAATGLIIAAIAASATILGVIIAGRRIQAEAM